MAIIMNKKKTGESDLFRLFFLFFIRHFPNICKYRQRAVRQKAHQKKTFIRIDNINLTHTASVQNLLNFLKEMMLSCIGIIILHFLGHDKKFKSNQIKTFYREFMVHNAVNPLPAEPFLTEMTGKYGS